MKERYVGIDLGGTNIRAALATGPASHGDHVEHRTPADDGPDAVLDACAAAVREVSGGTPPDGVVIGIPGPLDPGTGVVFAAPHLRGWKNINARDLLAQRCGCRVEIHNDASLAGYAEWIAGAGIGTRDMVFVTVSTGVGGALIVNGDLVAGTAGTAGEVGHVPIGIDAPPCGSGHVGCLEGTASGTAIADRAKAELAAGAASTMTNVDGELDARAVEAAAQTGDVLAIALYRDAGRALGRCMGGLINMLSPEVIVVGGGLINAGELLFAPLRAAVTEIAFDMPARRCRIVEAQLGTDAGLVGATAWAVHTFGQDG